MADFPAPVANQGLIPPQAGTQTLSNIMGMRQQRADIQTAQANAQIAKQNASQKAGIANWFKNVNTADYAGADGTWDMNKVLTDPSLRQVAGDQYPEVVSQLINVKKGQLDNRKALADLNQDVVGQFNQQLGALRTDKDVVADNEAGRNKVETAINRFAALGPDGERIAGIYGPMVEHAPQGKLVDNLSVAQMQAEDASTQAANQNPDYVNKGGKLVNIHPQAAGAGEDGGPTLTNTPSIKTNPPPGYGSFQDQGGNTWFYNLQNPREMMPASDAGKGNKPVTPAAQTQTTPAKPAGPAYMPVGAAENQKQSALNDEDLYNKVILPGANQAPQNKSALINLERLADSGVFTGTGSADVAATEAALAQIFPGFKGAGDAAKDRQLASKYTQQLALSLTQSNYGTDAGKEMVEHAIPNADNMGPGAMKAAAQYIMGQQQIAEARGNIARSYIEKNGSSRGVRQIDSQFMQNIDPRMFDMLGMTADQQADYVKKNFKSKQEWDDFRSKMGVINHMGGFNQPGGPSGQ